MTGPDNSDNRAQLEPQYALPDYVSPDFQQGPAQQQKELVSPEPKKQWLQKLGPVGVALAFAFGKLKWLLLILKVTKLGTLITMLLAIWAYAMLWGAPFAIGFVLLIFVHEMGHALMLRQQGIPAGAPVFIPFVGAFIAMKGQPRDAYVEALVGIGGPALGALAALVCLFIGYGTGSLIWFALASSGFFLNLFNMLPVSPLDGGRITGVISRWLWLPGYLVGIAVLFVSFSPILVLILILGLVNLWSLRKNRDPAYYQVPAAKRVAMGVAFFGLLALLTLGMWLADSPLKALHKKAQESRGSGAHRS